MMGHCWLIVVESGRNPEPKLVSQVIYYYRVHSHITSQQTLFLSDYVHT
jgi:hypothetical protein